MSKHTTLEQLKLLAQRTESEISKVESKSLVGVKVNGVALAIADKMVDILIASGATNGTLSVAGKDVAVTGLAALAYKAQIFRDECRHHQAERYRCRYWRRRGRVRHRNGRH